MYKGRISEIFKSIQGEGPYLGISQVFVRFYGCNLDCTYCDTRQIYFKEMSVEEVKSNVYNYQDYHSISITGGEPLLQVDFLMELLPQFKQDKKLIYLETNGVLYQNLKKIISWVDIIAMDFKLPSSCGSQNLFIQHRYFLEEALKRETFIKVVITPSTNEEELVEVFSIARSIRPEIIFVLQPQHPYEEALKERIGYFSDLGRIYLPNIRVIPQMHKILGVR
ncbi:MAG: 7-carboxy-7-deazaguanine synthase QueE [Candidatus Omnitrophica bacterium]|nr:7-carboxy-7-deazaguanine synthase QueE [Candidatus Omnitrophota bacterium]MCM8826781.1 7-carboxy-7-deazaguanine synthase QueE [Candidatus Omnitrophota bacterium]